MENISDFDLGWLVGILEGEGCFHLSIKNKKDYRYGYGRPIVRVAMTDEDTVRSILAILKAGSITGPQHIKNRIKPIWTWTLSGKQAITLMHLILPYMKQRRQNKINEILAEYYYLDRHETTGRIIATQEHRDNISSALVGRKRTEETKTKLSNSKRGQPWSEKRRALWLQKTKNNGI